MKRNSRGYRGRRSRWLVGLLMLLLIGLLTFGALEAVVLTGSVTDLRQEPDVMVILGAQVKPWGPSILLQDRLDTALDYLEGAPELPIVVSGGQGDDEHMSEARCMFDYLVEHGVDAGRILMEDRSRNTAQNLEYTLALLEGEGYDLADTHLLVVSNGFHLARARLLAGRLGQEVSTLAAPASHAPSRVQMFFREPLALLKSTLFDLRN